MVMLGYRGVEGGQEVSKVLCGYQEVTVGEGDITVAVKQMFVDFELIYRLAAQLVFYSFFILGSTRLLVQRIICIGNFEG